MKFASASLAALAIFGVAQAAPSYKREHQIDSPTISSDNGVCSNVTASFPSMPFAEHPVLHYSPPEGWMNDPNGLFFDQKDKLWHMYYQYQPNGTLPRIPIYWGHATSEDLLKWKTHQPAIGPDEENTGIFSGSIVIDHHNTSGFFDESVHPDQRIVAFYTLHTATSETQELAYSVDKGYTFTKYEGNPVLSANSSQFRDPKVFWHEESSQWIMMVVKSQEYKIQIFGSQNLTSWTYYSSFTGGYLGYQYECPDLIRLPVENPEEGQDDYKWVMVLAINPGAVSSGSVNQYFIGSFDGYKFEADDNVTRFMDLGKDFYAFQSFSAYTDEVFGLAWGSNWDYGNKIPTTPWRGSMSLPRKYTLRNVRLNPETNDLGLVQTPVFNSSINWSQNITVVEAEEKNVAFNLTNNSSVKTSFAARNESTVLDFDLKFKVTNSTGYFELLVESGLCDGGSIKIGFDAGVSAVFIDRTTDTEISHFPLYTNKQAQYVEPQTVDENGLRMFEIYGIVDKDILELYINGGVLTMTDVFFLPGYPAQMTLTTKETESFVEFETVQLRKIAYE